MSGAMQAPFFFKGVTTEDEWRTTLRSSPVPWAEIGSDKWVKRCTADTALHAVQAG